VIYVARKKELTVDERIDKEIKSLKRSYKDLPGNKKASADRLIPRAAYMRVTLENYEKDMKENGSYEMFTQSKDTPPYERDRPVARLYNTMNKNYQSIMKQIDDLAPKQEAKQEDDGFGDFITSRQD
jgi:hypothetical protein